ncbi:cupin domain-containing protein [Erythrobacter sp. sf7]|uniref:Cupin domain-containing protein n=1 Tax=Erythrobacter fulvus TaxID=2987523 RepID=A0ABT5JNF9_9SPHN|nr:cupin domain-containing protein [Erythrobacter fulvus]MDC8753673.1 cupin domain-containing protein [Erythrobacter fulvus]
MKKLAVATGLAVVVAIFATTAGQSQSAGLPDALAAGWQGEPVCELQHQAATHRVLLCTFPPGVGHERHYHPAHFGYALSGGTMRLTSEAGIREAEVEAGSSFSSTGVDWHEAVNIGETTVAYLMIEEL